MCLAVPMRIVELEGNTALCELEGVRRRIRVDFLHAPKVGDYVIAHAGFAIERLEPEQARANLQTIMEVADAARERV